MYGYDMRTDHSLDTVPDDHLEYVERMLFLEFDEAYRRYYQDDLPVLEEVRMYEQALETITLVRKAKQEGRLESIQETGKQTLEVLDDLNQQH